MKSIRINACIIILFLMFDFSAYSQIAKSNFSKKATTVTEQWQVHDLEFYCKIPPSTNPFDIEFGAIYRGPNGQILKVPGFYDGSGNWVARFSTNGIGTWTYETYSSQAQLSGLKGSIEVLPNTRPKQKGAVQIDAENPQGFAYEDGSPHFLMAYELDWLFALDYGNPNGLPKSEKILEDVAKHGFNHIVMNLYAYDVGWKIAGNIPDGYFYGRPEYGPFQGTNENPDFSRLNLKLFQHLDRVFALMQQKGLDAHLMIYVWNKKVNWPDMYSKADNLYFDYIVDRYQAFSNVIWDVSKEALDYGRCDIPYLDERIHRIRQRDAYKRLVTIHDYEYNSRHPEKVDFVSIQSWRSDLYSLMLQARVTHPDKPVVNIEHGGYETGPYQTFVGNYTDAKTCLERTYQCIFAGVYGSYYWQNTAWNIVIWDALDTKHSFEPPRYDYYRHLSSLFARYSYNEFQPSIPKLTTNSKGGNDNLATNGYCLYNGRGTYLMLVPKESERIAAVLPKPISGSLKMTWFNPFTGEYSPETTLPWTGWNEVISPWQYEMSVLILEEVK